MTRKTEYRLGTTDTEVKETLEELIQNLGIEKKSDFLAWIAEHKYEILAIDTIKDEESDLFNGQEELEISKACELSGHSREFIINKGALTYAKKLSTMHERKEQGNYDSPKDNGRGILGHADNRIEETFETMLNQLAEGLMSSITKTKLQQLSTSNYNTVKRWLKSKKLFELLNKPISLANLNDNSLALFDSVFSQETMSKLREAKSNLVDY